MHLTKVLMAAGLALAVTAQARPGPKTNPDLPAPYAVIEWPDLSNPRFVTLGGDHYLLAVRAGILRDYCDSQQLTRTTAANWAVSNAD